MAPQSNMAAVDKEMPERHPGSTATEVEKRFRYNPLQHNLWKKT